jgi:cytochrome c biogenesis protein CcdA/thiol-disulfide isomerase/thioredoxin
MLLLLLFALIAGAGTAITPCVLPVLPALLSVSSLGGRRRPIGIVLGLAITFAISIIALAQLVKGVGVGSSVARDIAVVVLIAFGFVLLIPALAERVQAPLSRLARFGPKNRGDGFRSGLLVGGALGFVCAPCAGPILATVISVSATTGPTAKTTLLALAYTAGLSAMLLLYAFGGRAALARIRKVARGQTVERVMAVVLLATGVALAFNLDGRLDNAIANDTSLPAIFSDPTKAIETSQAVQSQLNNIRPPDKFAERQAAAARRAAAAARSPVSQLRPVANSLPHLGLAPNFTDTEDWFNTPGDRPLSIEQLRGHVVLVDFWTYTCINCIRTLPFIKGLYAHYHRYGLDIVGVETPEFTFEQVASNVRQAIASDGIKYPVVQDNEYGTWNAYQNNSWPADYMIDAQGNIRHVQIGEGDYGQEETDVRALLVAAGAKSLPSRMTARAIIPSSNLGTPETYLNSERDQGFSQPIQLGTHSYATPIKSLELNEWALNGAWTAQTPANPNDEGSITPAGAAASSGGIQARDVYLVLTSNNGQPRRVRVLLGGVPIPARFAGTDVGPGGWVTVKAERLYSLVALTADAQFEVTVEVPKGVSAYDFTFS